MLAMLRNRSGAICWNCRLAGASVLEHNALITRLRTCRERALSSSDEASGADAVV
jgi:hypothetical protein